MGGEDRPCARPPPDPAPVPPGRKTEEIDHEKAVRDRCHARPGAGTLAPSARAGDDKDKDKDKGDSSARTICGVVAGVTAEGETVFDYKANRATTVEAAYLTVVGAPKDDMDKAGSDHNNNNAAADRNDKDRNSNNSAKANASASGTDHKRRDSVYIVWLSPKTKVCECSDSSGKKEDKKADVALDKLEVGDRVEIQFVRRDTSSGNTPAHQSDAMARKHGRHRMFVGDANSITIMPTEDMKAKNDKSSSGERARE